MEWVKERILKYEREDANYVDTTHVMFYKHRSDGTVWYQLARWLHISKCDTEPNGRIAQIFNRFLEEKMCSPSMSDEEFDSNFEKMMNRYKGVEITVNDLPQVN